MRTRLKAGIVTVCLVFCVVAIAVYVNITDPYEFTEIERHTPDLTKEEKEYIKENPLVELEMSNDAKNLGTEFLHTYLNSIFGPSGFKVELKDMGEGEESVGSLVIMNDEIRDRVDELDFTASIIQLSKGMYVKKDVDLSKPYLTGINAGGYFSEEEEDRITYEGKEIRFKEASDADEAVDMAEKGGYDCVIGCSAVILEAMEEAGIQDRYRTPGGDPDRTNLCIAIPRSDSDIYDIMNSCIVSVDRETLMNDAWESSRGVPYMITENNRYEDSLILVVIVFAAVLCTFILYYISSRRLYGELDERMQQLTSSKMEMQTTFNGVSYYMAEISPEGDILDINKAFLTYVGRGCLGENITAVMDLSSENTAVIQDMIRSVAENEKGESKEIILDKQILEISIFPVSDLKGGVSKLLFMAEDVTRVNMAERQMIQDNKMIAVGQLAAGMAHEIKNPLGIIKNYCYVLKNMKDEGAKRQAVAGIEKAADSAGRIIDTVLDFSRASGRKKERKNIGTHISGLLMMNDAMIREKEISVSLECEEDFAVMMAVESFDMILVNLIKNSVDAMDEKGKLTIRAAQNSERGEFTVQVRDTGPGIDKSVIDDIFNPFFTTKKEGTGLGLYIVYNEVQKMDGSIRVTETSYEGTAIEVTLPIEAGEE